MPISARYGGATYSGSRLGRSGQPGNGIAVPEFDAVYYWTAQSASAGYGLSAYGGHAQVQYPSAGVFAAPDPASGTATIWAWWAWADEATLTRVHPDGERVPVRSSPVPLQPQLSRRNQATNPKARDSLTGYTAAANTDITRLTGQTTPSPQVTTAVRMTARSAGSVSVAVTTDPVNATEQTVSFWARTAATVSDLRVSIHWYDATSTVAGTQTYSAPTTARTQAVGAWSWVSIPVTSWPAAAVVGVLSVQATGADTGDTVDITGRLTELGPLAGDYFDGDFPGSSWTGEPGVSFSDTSEIAYTIDAEVPLDTPVRYELTSGRAPGFTASTTEVTVSGQKFRPPYDTLLTHPGLAWTVPVWIESEPEITNTIQQGAFQVIGRRNKVVISGPQRSGDEGELTFICETLEQRQQLLDMLDDGSPLLVRTKAGYGHPGDWWLSAGDITLPPPGSGAANTTNEVRRVTVPFIEVDRPSAATRPLVA